MTGQISHIQNMPAYNRLFHNCVVNQYGLVSVNRKFLIGNYFDEHKNLFFPLNKASYNLQAFCDLCLKELDVPSSHSCGLEKAKELASQWKKLILEGNAFLTYSYAEQVISFLVSAGCDVLAKLYSERYKGVPRTFLDIPAQLKSFLRVDFFLQGADKEELLLHLLRSFDGNPDLFRYIECIETAIDDPDLMAGANFGTGPSISIFFDKLLVRTHTLPQIMQLTEALALPPDHFVPQETDFSFVMNNMVFSQGRRNYKKFLRLIALLDEVYDKSYNYAFIQPSQLMTDVSC